MHQGEGTIFGGLSGLSKSIVPCVVRSKKSIMASARLLQMAAFPTGRCQIKPPPVKKSALLRCQNSLTVCLNSMHFDSEWLPCV